MEVNVKVTHEFGPQAAAILTAIMGGVAASPAAKAPVKNTPAADGSGANTKADTTADNAGEGGGDDGDVAPTLDRLREVLKEKKSNKDGILALLKKYKAANISAVDEKDYAKFYKELKAL